jgi:hypothetical protein
MQALGVGETGVQERERRREALAKTPDELRRESDLRHQYQGSPALREHARDQVQIDLGLAAAGDAVQQIGAKARKPGADGFDRARLLRVEGKSLRLSLCQRRRRCEERHIERLDPAALNETAHERTRVGRKRGQLLRAATRLFDEVQQHGALARRAAAARRVTARHARLRLRPSVGAPRSRQRQAATPSAAPPRTPRRLDGGNTRPPI